MVRTEFTRGIEYFRSKPGSLIAAVSLIILYQENVTAKSQMSMWVMRGKGTSFDLKLSSVVVS